MTEPSYAEALKAEFDMIIQLDAFGFNRTISIEVSTYEYCDKDNNVVINERNVNTGFSSYFSYDSAHNVSTTFEHMKNIIQWMYSDIFS